MILHAFTYPVLAKTFTGVHLAEGRVNETTADSECAVRENVILINWRKCDSFWATANLLIDPDSSYIYFVQH